jgi:hypothetical protein
LKEQFDSAMGYKREAAGLPEAGGMEQKFCPIRIGGVGGFHGRYVAGAGFSDLSEGGYGRFAY